MFNLIAQNAQSGVERISSSEPVRLAGSPRLLRRHPALLRVISLLAFGAFLLASSQAILAQTMQNSSIVWHLENASERMEMIVNTSRILTLDQKIPQAQVNNPEVLQLVALSPTQIQISAKRPGVTQVNLWTEDKKIYSVDVIVFGDARELSEVLKSQFPNASLQVTPVANSVRISGFMDQPEHVPQVLRIAEEYYPKVINNITVSGVHQVVLHVRIMEVSRTKLRTLGFDWAQISGLNGVVSTASGLISSATAAGVAMSGKETLAFQVIEPGGSFFGVLEALREDKLLKILAEPNLVTISGRPAYFQVGGSVPTLVPQSLGTVSVEYKKYGTQVDFVPIVLGNGRIRLEVRPKVSEIDSGRSIQYEGYTIYAFNEREVETGVEMQAGQTLAIAGLIQNRIESQRRGLPWVIDVPYVGALFRRVEDQNNEVELLIMVTPELVEPLNPDQVPPCGPGLFTKEPTDWELGLKGHIEVPACYPPNGPDCAGNVPNEGEPEDMPGMILEPRPESNTADGPELPPTVSVGSSDRWTSSSGTHSQPRISRHNPLNPQIPQTPGSRATEKPLPGFKGRVGYEMLR
ncbi:MAG: pilus assembly protein N-terminal domain-containing protein [Pirellulales bacterium]|nr:pilus assembly protein N-terminal domain-containing protein [Pirellulales bacterium]